MATAAESKMTTSELKVATTAESKMTTSELKVATAAESKVPTSELKVANAEPKATTSEIKVATTETKMATADESLPSLIDVANSPSQAKLSDRKLSKESTATKQSVIGSVLGPDDAWHDDLFEEPDEEDDEDEEGDEDEVELEDDEEDQGETETDFDSEGDEEEGEEISEESDASQPDFPKRLFEYHGSDAEFQPSNLEDRKKRRFLIGAHSFYELTDPHLENALEPEDVNAVDDSLFTTEEKARQSLKDEKKLYRDTCTELGVKPEPRVLASLREPTMNLKGMAMNEKEITAVCKLLEQNKHVRFLNLAGNAVGGNGGQAVADLIAQNTTITGYDFSGTEILEAFEAICTALAQNPVVTYLNFSKDELEDIDMPHLKKVITALPELTTLILNANLIRDAGLKHIGQGLSANTTLELLDLSNNKILGEKTANVFFTSCAEHPALRIVNLRRNFITDEGGKGVGRILGNQNIEELDASFNLMGDASAPAISRALGKHPSRELKILQMELQRWYQDQAAIILKPFGNDKLEMPIELIDFGMMLDVHTTFLKAKEKALKVHPDVKIIHGQTYGLEHAKGPDLRQLVIRKADNVCTSFETTLVMLMEELAKEKKVLTLAEFRKFIKQCNLYKDKTITEAFEKVFAMPGNPQTEVNTEAIIEAFDKEYPGLRVIPEPPDEDEEEEMEEKPVKKKKGKKEKKGGGGAKAGAGGAAKGKKGGKKK